MTEMLATFIRLLAFVLWFLLIARVVLIWTSPEPFAIEVKLHSWLLLPV